MEVTDEDLIAALGPGEGKNPPRKLLARLRESGRDTLLRDEIRMRKAAEAIAEPEADPDGARGGPGANMDPGKGRSRGRRPAAEKESKAGELWTRARRCGARQEAERSGAVAPR